MRQCDIRGFTMLEALVVVMLMVAVTLFTAPFLSQSVLREDLDSTVAGISDALREAQAAVMSGRGSERYGMHFQGDRYVWFIGASYSVSDPDNVEHELAGRLSISGVSLSPGGACTLPDGTGNCDVLFTDRRGAPATSGSVTVTDGDQSRTVTINAAGMIDRD